MQAIIDRIREFLRTNADEHTFASSSHFFKEEVKLYGVRIPLVNKISKDVYLDIKDRSKQDIFDICNVLWQSGISEESYIACNLAYFIEDRYIPDDFALFEQWVKNYVSNWASCDTLCNHTIGAFVEKFPEYVRNLKVWAKNENRWVRRAAAVTLIIPARKGLFLKDIFEIADILLTDKDDLVQKGYGWMLKAASEFYPREVFNYVLSKKTIMPRTAYRYALEKCLRNGEQKRWKSKIKIPG